MAATKIYLVPEDGSPAYELVKDITLVGRSRVCDIQLRDRSVSKLHCVLVKTDNLVMVRDLGSTNGTRVKEVAVKRGLLLPGDSLGIARLTFRVKFVSADAPPPSANESQIQTEYPFREEQQQLAQAVQQAARPAAAPAYKTSSRPLPEPAPPELPSIPPVADLENEAD